MLCPNCGKKTILDVAECKKCGYDFYAASQGLDPMARANALASSNVPTFNEDPLGTIIPYRNIPALVGYYLAVFSLIPCLGLPLGLAAVPFGIAGKRKLRTDPCAKGRVHASIAVWLGSATILAWGAVLLAMVASIDFEGRWVKQISVIRPGMSEQEIIEHLGVPGHVKNGPFTDDDILNYIQECANDASLEQCIYSKSFSSKPHDTRYVRLIIYYGADRRVCECIQQSESTSISVSYGP